MSVDVAQRTSWGIVCGRVVVLLLLLPVLAFYLIPRVVDLVATPYRLTASTDHAADYNQGLGQIVAHEQDTLRALGAIDRIDASLDEVIETDAAVARDLATLITQIESDLQPVLDDAGTNVGDLSRALTRLEASIRALNFPVGAAQGALADDRTTMSEVLRQAKATAAAVREARDAAGGSAENMEGRHR